MYIAPGFEPQSVMTTLGNVTYATPLSEFWPAAAAPTSLMFLHGFGGGSSSYEWSKVYPAFATDYQVIAPDLPGWGQSDHPQRNYQKGDYQGAISELLHHLTLEGAVVVASSLTAAIMVRLAVEQPTAVKGLVLIAPAGISDFGKDFQQSFLPKVLQVPVLDRVLYQTAIATPVGIRGFLAERQFANADLIAPEMVAAYLASAQQPNAEYAALSFVRGDLCFDLAEWMPRLQVPTVILWGREAQFTKVQLGQKLASLNSEAIKHFEIIEGVGLTPQLEQPGITIALIRKALEVIEVAARK